MNSLSPDIFNGQGELFKTGDATLGYSSSIYFILIYSLSEKLVISHIPV